MAVGELFVIIISSMLVSNVVLSQFLGICPFLGVSKKVETAVGMGAAVTFVITIASAITYPFYIRANRSCISGDDRIYPDHCSTGSVY